MKTKTISCLNDFYFAPSNLSTIKVFSGIFLSLACILGLWGTLIGVYGIFKIFLNVL